MTERLFPIRPRLAGAKIAMATARVRHWATIPKEKGVLHLFDFGEELEAALATAPLDEAWVSVEPFATAGAFGNALRRAVPDGIGYTFLRV